jgi:hypothetical protein
VSTVIARPGSSSSTKMVASTASSASASFAAMAASSAQSSAFQDSVVNASMKMSALCDSSFYKRHAGKRGRTADSETSNTKSKSKKANSQQSTAASSSSNAPGSTTPRAGAIGTLTDTSTGPRVEIINGRIVVKESSLLLNPVSTTVEDDYEEVVEGVHATATYSSFLKRRPSPAWGIEETRLFYSALRQTGLQFTMMQAFFPGRTRQQLKRKYLREQQNHPDLIDLALNTSLPLDMAPFQAQLGDLDKPPKVSGNADNISSADNVTSAEADSPEVEEGTVEV